MVVTGLYLLCVWMEMEMYLFIFCALRPVFCNVFIFLDGDKVNTELDKDEDVWTSITIRLSEVKLQRKDDRFGK